MIYFDEFLKYLKACGLKEITIVNLDRNLSRFFQYFYAQHLNNETEVTPGFIEHFEKYLTHQNYSILTRSRCLHTVKRYFKYLYNNKLIFMDPCLNLEIPKRKKSLPKDILTEAEMLHFLNAINTDTLLGIRDKAIFELLYSSAIRYKELLNLNVYDVDIENSELRINNGKGGKDRVLPIGKIAKQCLVKYLKNRVQGTGYRGQRNSKRRVNSETAGQALFLSRYGKRLKYLMPKLQHYKQKARITKRVAFHTFRHSCATHMLRGGADIRYVQELLGHSELNTTQIYTRLVPVDLKAAHKKAHPRKKETF